MTTKLDDKRDRFGFHIMIFPFMSSNIPSAPAYGVYASQLICYARCCSNYSDFLPRHRALLTRLLSQGYKVNRLSNTFKKFYGRHRSSWTIQAKAVEMILFLMDLPMVKLIKLAKMAGVMHEADHAYYIWSTW